MGSVCKNKVSHYLKFKIHTISNFTNNNIGHLFNCTINGGVEYEIDYLNYMGITEEKYPDEIKRYKIEHNTQSGDVNENIRIV